jgi:hypothetical protein
MRVLQDHEDGLPGSERLKLPEQCPERTLLAALRTEVQGSILRPKLDGQQGRQQRDGFVVVCCCRRKNGFEFGELLIWAVLTFHAGGSYDLADDRMERAVLVIRRAMVLQPGLGLGLQPLDQRSREARLANPRFAGDQHHAPFAGLRLLPAPHE